MTIQEYLQGIMEEQGFDAYAEEEDRLITMRENDLLAWIHDKGQDTFHEELERLGIDTDSETLNEWLMSWAE